MLFTPYARVVDIADSSITATAVASDGTVYTCGSNTLGQFAQEIAQFKPLAGVAGNCDNYDLRYTHPMHRVFNCGGLKVLMTHIGGYPGRYDAKARKLINEHRPDIFVCGHSHILKVVRDPSYNGMLVLNPGAAGIQGFHVVRTALRFHIDEGRIHDMEVFELDR